MRRAVCGCSIGSRGWKKASGALSNSIMSLEVVDLPRKCETFSRHKESAQMLDPLANVHMLLSQACMALSSLEGNKRISICRPREYLYHAPGAHAGLQAPSSTCIAVHALATRLAATTGRLSHIFLEWQHTTYPSLNAVWKLHVPNKRSKPLPHLPRTMGSLPALTYPGWSRQLRVLRLPCRIQVSGSAGKPTRQGT